MVHIAWPGQVRDTAGGLDTSCATCEGLQLQIAGILQAVVIGQRGLCSC